MQIECAQENIKPKKDKLSIKHKHAGQPMKRETPLQLKYLVSYEPQVRLDGNYLGGHQLKAGPDFSLQLHLPQDYFFFFKYKLTAVTFQRMLQY